MVVSRNTQLGLMYLDDSAMREYLQDFENFNKKIMYDTITKIPDGDKENDALPEPELNSGDILFKEICSRLAYKPELKGSEFYTVKHPNPFYYLIQPSVNTCAEMIRVQENFSCCIFDKIKDGEYMYLLGKQELFHFVKYNRVVRANYWNTQSHLAFEIGFHLEKDRYYYPGIEKDQFNRLVRLMIFIELGDIETVYLESGRNNGKPKKEGKVTNTSQYNVYVVDSSWNKLIIRTEGFAVRGHFRLQPCGIEMADRKLIWINAFEKHGYKRSPKAQIAA